MREVKQDRTIYLLRHGRIGPASSERRYIGQLDVALSGEGVRQARRLQAAFAGKAITAVFCSDLIRSIDTARIISAGLTANLAIRSDLREVSMGDWEGKTMGEIVRHYPQEYVKRGNNIGGYRIPGAESFAEGQSRIVAAFADITASTAGDIIIVGHAGVNRLLLCYLLGIPIDNLFRIVQDYGCINVLTDGGGEYRVKLLNGRHAR